MADFKDRLWRDLVREHGADLARIDRAAHRRPRRRVVAAGAAGLAAGGAALLVALGTSGTPPAFAVNRLPDGTVRVTINRVEGFRGANARLEKLGVHVRAVPFVAGCATLHGDAAARMERAMRNAVTFARRDQGAIMSVGIDPKQIHPGKVLVLAARPGEVSPASLVGEAKEGKVPDCVGTVTPVPPAPGSVVCHTADGQDLPLPPKQVAPDDTGVTGASGNSGTSPGGGTPAPVGRGIICQARVPHAGQSGNSGNSGASGVTGNS
jgi:hypothetical protein